MIQKIKTRLLQITALSLLATFGFTGVVAAQSTSTTNPQGAICKGANTLSVKGAGADATSDECTSEDPSDKVDSLIKQIINIFSVIVGIIAVIMIIYGGLKYITSGGDSGNVTGAKNTILYAIIGLIIVALAQFVVRFILSKTADSV